MKHFFKSINKLIDTLAVLAGIILCSVSLLLCCDAVGRTLLGFPALAEWGYSIPWALETAEYALYLMTFLGTPWVLGKNGHIRIDLITEILPKEIHARLSNVTNAIGFFVSGILFFYSCQVGLASFRDKVLIYETFVFPEWTLLSAAPLTFFLTTCIFFVRTFPSSCSFYDKTRENGF